MDKETTILIIAQNGLQDGRDAARFQGGKIEKQADKATDPQQAAKLKKKAAKNKKLSAILLSADEGITAYLRESEEQ